MRRSTSGWNIWNTLLDLTGGFFSSAQLVLDCAVDGDWSGITGDLAKMVLGVLSIIFDFVFILQHYVFYRKHADGTSLLNRDVSCSDDDPHYTGFLHKGGRY